MSTNSNRNPFNYSHDTEARKKGPFSMFCMSYVLPPDPTDFATPHHRHQWLMNNQRQRKIERRELHQIRREFRNNPLPALV